MKDYEMAAIALGGLYVLGKFGGTKGLATDIAQEATSGIISGAGNVAAGAATGFAQAAVPPFYFLPGGSFDITKPATPISPPTQIIGQPFSGYIIPWLKTFL